jgi:hypothetical protein
MPLGALVCRSGATSARDSTSLGAGIAPPAPAPAQPPRLAAAGTAGASSMLFQAPQSGHCPDHFGWAAPQALQT